MADRPGTWEPETVADLAHLLRQLRRREARRADGAPLTYRQIAAKTGWSHGIIGEYLSGRVLPPTDRFDVLIRLLGAEPAEQGWLATARDRVEERRRDAARGPAPGKTNVARQLPAAVPGFAGRVAELAELDRLLEPDPGTPVVAVSGTAGVGKTALALHWAHRVAGHFPDGQLYVNLRGFDPSGTPVAPADAVRALLDALGVPPQRIPASLDGQLAVYRGLLAGRRMLIVLDNARDAGQVRPLLAGAPTCRTLVTSRDQMTGLVTTDGARPVLLGLLSDAEARQLLAARIGAERMAAEPAAVDEIVAAGARLPLALAIVAARAAVHPTFPLASLTAELHTGDPATDTHSVFSWSYRALGPAPATLFRLLALHPGPDTAPPAMASLLGVPLPRVMAAVAELASANLLMEHSPGRYAYHDLLRAYAGQMTQRVDAAGSRRAAGERLLDHYLRSAHSADQTLDPHRDPIPLPPSAPGVTPVEPADHGAALAWFDTELPALLGMLAEAEAAGSDLRLCRLTRAMAHYLERRGHWQPWIASQERAVAAARRLADPVEEAHARRSIGRACLHLGRPGAAGGHFGAALVLFREAGDHVGHARILMDLSWSCSAGWGTARARAGRSTTSAGRWPGWAGRARRSSSWSARWACWNGSATGSAPRTPGTASRRRGTRCASTGRPQRRTAGRTRSGRSWATATRKRMC